MSVKRSSATRVGRWATMLIALIGATGAVGLAATPANASIGDCTGSYLCFWKNSNYNDGPGRVAGTNTNFSNLPHSSCGSNTWNNCISSLYNRRGLCARLYYNTGATGPLHYLSSGDVYYNLATQIPSLNDAISSNSFGSTASC